MPKISVIIPCYNAEKYLKQCIDSVMNQTLKDIEIICVDDGSKDRTMDILREYEAIDSRIKVLCQQNRFAGVARNTGMAAATGNYIAFLDADDFYAEDGLEKAYEIANMNSLDMLKMSSYLLDDCTDEITTNNHYSHANFEQKDQVLVFQDAPQKLMNCADVAWNGLYSRKFIQENHISFNDFRCVNDRSFYISCLLLAKRIMVTDVFLTYYRRNIAGSLVSTRHKFFDCQIRSYNLIKKIALAAHIDNAQKKMILQYELNQIFIWYEKFLNSGVNTFYVEEIIRRFIADFDVSDVGQEFLPKFQRKQYFERLKKSLQIDWKQKPVSVCPEITVVVPTYNGVKYLSECIESILLQTFENFELICVNDGSTDESLAILQCFAEKDCRIRVVEQQQSGAGVARNKAISLSSGKYLVFIDCDDKVHEDYLSNLYTTAEKNTADVVVTQRIAWNGCGEGAVMRNWVADKRLPKKQVFSYKDIPDYILNFADGAPGGKLFRRELILHNNIQYLPIKRSEDFHFVFTAFIIAERISYMDMPGYFYRKNNTASLENTKDETPLLFWEATLTFKNNLERLGCLEEIRRSYLNNAINRMAFNLKAVKTYAGFASVFNCFKQVSSTELELDVHDAKYFYDNTSYNYLLPMLKYETPEEFMHAEYKRQIQEINQLRQKSGNVSEINDLKNSVSYKVGRMITFIPRKVRGLLWCVKENGLGYTIKYALKKMTHRV